MLTKRERERERRKEGPREITTIMYFFVYDIVVVFKNLERIGISFSNGVQPHLPDLHLYSQLPSDPISSYLRL